MNNTIQKSTPYSDLKDYVSFMYKYARSYNLTLVILVALIVIFIISGRLIPLIFGWAVDYGIKDKNINFIYRCGFALIACNSIRAVVSYLISFKFRFMGQEILYRVRRDLLEHIQKIKISFFDKNASGKIVTRISNDTKSLGDLFADGLSGAFINIVEIFSILAALFLISWHMALCVVLILPPVLWFGKVLSDKIREQFILIKSKLSAINAFSAENLNGIEVLQLYGGETQVAGNFDKNVDEYKNLQLNSVAYFALLWPIIEFFQVFSILISLIVGFYLLNDNLVTIGQIGAFVLLLQSFFRPLRFILEKYNQIQNGVTSSQRIIKLFNENTEFYSSNSNSVSSDLAVQALDFGKDFEDPVIKVSNLNFSYDGKNKVIKDLNFEITSGSKTAIVGRTGSGKTTLVSLLQGFYPSPTGSMKIYNMSIETLPIDFLRKKLLVVRQDEFIFKGTVKSNILISSGERSITDYKLKEILDQVGLELTLDSEVDEMGANLSAGEKQLIALARVMVYDPEIIILDEATSHIDTVSEQKVLKAFDKIMSGRTSIVIAHRLTTVLKADQILILNDGKLVETGHPDELLRNPESVFNTFYNELL